MSKNEHILTICLVEPSYIIIFVKNKYIMKETYEKLKKDFEDAQTPDAKEEAFYVLLDSISDVNEYKEDIMQYKEQILDYYEKFQKSLLHNKW